MNTSMQHFDERSVVIFFFFNQVRTLAFLIQSSLADILKHFFGSFIRSFALWHLLFCLLSSLYILGQLVSHVVFFLSLKNPWSIPKHLIQSLILVQVHPSPFKPKLRATDGLHNGLFTFFVCLLPSSTTTFSFFFFFSSLVLFATGVIRHMKIFSWHTQNPKLLVSSNFSSF